MVVGVAQDGLDDLQNGSDAGAARNHAHGACHIGAIQEFALGPAEFGPIANLQGGQVARGISLRISLDEQLKVAQDIVQGDGRVAADDLLAVPESTQLQVLQRREDGLEAGRTQAYLADGQIEAAILIGQLEAINAGVVRDLALLKQLKLVPLLRVNYTVVWGDK